MMADEGSIDIDYVARLARLELTEQEKETYANQLQDILAHFKKLQSADVEGVEPIAHPFALENVWREDEAGPTWGPEKSLQNAPETRDSQVVVPKVVEDA